MVPPEWHGWLHYTFDEPPSYEGDFIQFKIHRNAVPFSDAPKIGYLGYRNPVEQDIMHNFSQWKPRGYGIGNLHQGPFEKTKILYATRPHVPS